MHTLAANLGSTALAGAGNKHNSPSLRALQSLERNGAVARFGILASSRIYARIPPPILIWIETTTVWPYALGAVERERDYRGTPDVCGFAEKLPVLTSGEDRAGSVSEHFFGDATFHQASQPAPTVRHLHDQIRG